LACFQGYVANRFKANLGPIRSPRVDRLARSIVAGGINGLSSY